LSVQGPVSSEAGPFFLGPEIADQAQVDHQ
jgi:hypothetical protein